MASGQSSTGYAAEYPQPPQGGQHPDPGRSNNHMQRRPPALTKEEIKVLEECNTESFWYRCVPLGAALSGGVTYLVHTGYLKRNPRWGPAPKSLGAFFLGYVLGKLSYQRTCQEKILQKIPNSNLAQSVRKARGMVTTDSFGEFSPDTSSPPDVASRPREEKMREVYSSMDVSDTDRRNVTELDDNLRPTVDREVKRKDDQSSESDQSLTYDELRHRNRQEYERNMATSSSSPFRQKPFPVTAPHPKAAAPPSEGPQTIWDAPEPPPSTLGTMGKATKQKNQYGDVWDN